MKTLILKAKSANSFDNAILKKLIFCIPGVQKPTVEQLRTHSSTKEIHLELTEGAYDGTVLRILKEVGTEFSIGR